MKLQNERINTLILGTSRLHRPFSKRVDGVAVTNNHPSVNIVFPKIGYFHTLSEIVQAAAFLMDSSSLPGELWKYVFRVEPRGSTPLNEFDPVLEASINKKVFEYKSPILMDNVGVLVVEVCSLTTNRFLPTGHVLHANPNFVSNVAYGDIYPDGFYKKFEPELPVEKAEVNIEDMVALFIYLRKLLPSRRIIVLSHLCSENYPNFVRGKIRDVTKSACDQSGCEFVDVANILDMHGFSTVNGARDIHHLSSDGENELARVLFRKVIDGL